MTLGSFQPRARVQGDKVDLKQYAGRPVLVRVNEYVPDMTSTQFPNPKPVVFFDLVDLITGQIFINVLSGAGAVVDNLRDHAGTEVALPLQFQNAVGGSGRAYIAVAALEPHVVAQAQQWYDQHWPLVDQERAKRQAAAAPAQAFGQLAPPAEPYNSGVVSPQAPAQQGFGQPQAAGMFTDTPPAAQPGQGFGAPQGTDPAAASAALAQLNGQLG